MLINPESTLHALEILLQIIYNQYFSNSYCITVISKILLKVEMTSTSKVYFDPSNRNESYINYLLSTSDSGCTDYFIQVDNFEEFMMDFAYITRYGALRRSGKKLVFLPSFIENNTESMMNVLNNTEASYVANILLIVPTETSKPCQVYNLISHRFVGKEPGVKDPILLDTWDSCSKTFKNNANLFPHDISNMMGKTVTVAGFTYEPYVILDIDKSIEPLGRDGIEVRIIEEFCRAINCTVEMVGVEDDGEWGELYENGTGYGLMGKLARDGADIAITSLYNWYDEYKFLDFSTCILRTAVTCLAPAPRLLVSWDLPLLPFSWTMWVLLLSTFVYASVVMVIAQGFSTDRVLLTTFGMMVTQSQFEAAVQWRVRSITGWLLVAGLVIDNAYSSGLAATFTVPKYEKSTDTIQDIVDSGMVWGAKHEAWVFSLLPSQDPKIQQLIRQFRVYNDEELREISVTRSMAFSIEQIQGGHFAIGEYITEEAVSNLDLMLEDLYYGETVFMLRKSSPYMDKVNDLTGKLQSAGILMAWETQVALKYLNNKIQLRIKLSRSRRFGAETVALSSRHLVGVFIIYLVGTSLSIFLFVAELLYERRMYRKLDTSADTYPETAN